MGKKVSVLMYACFMMTLLTHLSWYISIVVINQMCTKSFKEKTTVWVVSGDEVKSLSSSSSSSSSSLPSPCPSPIMKEGSFTTAVAIPSYNFEAQDHFYVLFFAASIIKVNG